jgi:hypothetical protein
MAPFLAAPNIPAVDTNQTCNGIGNFLRVGGIELSDIVVLPVVQRNVPQLLPFVFHLGEPSG